MAKFGEAILRWLEVLIRAPWGSLIEAFVPRRMLTGTTPIVPPGSVAGRSMTVVIAIMGFLGCLTTGAVYLVNQSAAAWFADIASEVTVQVRPAERADVDRQVTLVALYLSRQPGIANVTPLSMEASAEMLEPWLGMSGSDLSSLPVPRLIAVEIDREAPPDLDTVSSALENAFPNASLDDHRHWQRELRTVTRGLAFGGVVVLALMAVATIATIVSATRSALAANREIVDVLHFVGAENAFIAREFEKHFLAAGVRAGLVGAIGATLVFFLLPMTMQWLGGGTLAAAEFSRLIGPAVLDIQGYLFFVLVVVVVAALCMLTSRVGVYRILKSHG